eukprot:m.22453 g.22453  ORF g.22453 m.22453 type:complete len:237 (+) comp8301_c0_seq1:25-735(+)
MADFDPDFYDYGDQEETLKPVIPTLTFEEGALPASQSQLVVCCSVLSAEWARGSFLQGLSPIGTVKIEEKKTLATVFKTHNTLFVLYPPDPVDVDENALCNQLLSQCRPSYVAVLTELSASLYNTFTDEPLPATKMLHSSQASPLSSLGVFPLPNFVTGLPAALLLTSEIRGIPCHVAVTVRPHAPSLLHADIPDFALLDALLPLPSFAGLARQEPTPHWRKVLSQHQKQESMLYL